MIFFNPSDSSLPGLDGILLDICITVKAAAELTGYGTQYLRRLLRAGKLEGIKVGQVWLIRLASREAYLRIRQMAQHRRDGPRVVMYEAGKDAAG
jgi:excisionase family DNA binding protein